MTEYESLMMDFQGSVGRLQSLFGKLCTEPPSEMREEQLHRLAAILYGMSAGMHADLCRKKPTEWLLRESRMLSALCTRFVEDDWPDELISEDTIG